MCAYIQSISVCSGIEQQYYTPFTHKIANPRIIKDSLLHVLSQCNFLLNEVLIGTIDLTMI